MKQIPLYSLVIFPTPEQSALVKSYKQLLKEKIGWFGSANAAAHITVINFDNETMLSLYMDQIREFGTTITPQRVTFDHWDTFGDHTFFVAPNEPSQRYLDKIIVDLHQHLGHNTNTAHAHLSIARGLDANKMKTAYELFRNVELHLNFLVDGIYVRKFNEQTKQYSDIVEKISFGK
ncbi:2'-5' RNA ligase family protein [Flavobacterium sp. XGLA_31]|uniref:2'-5' RNA ligase family protein n=1 Tax=Flavobacterium sp. XGLA_31 TaxID=3447666 RepID=UPI003F319D76